MEIKIATWNVNSVRARLPVIIRWLNKEQPDVLCMQELKATNEQFPFDVFENLGYHCQVNGQVRWNGVAIISRLPISDVETDLSGFLPEQKRMISASVHGIKLINVYVPNGGEVSNPRFQEKLEYYQVLRNYALKFNKPTIILGDFNVAPNDIDTHSPEEQNGSICFHPLEREEINLFHSAGFTDVFRKLHDDEKAFTWWDYRAASFRRNRGMRLDLVLVNKAAENLITSCVIDKAPREWEKPSDHTPVIFVFKVSE